MEKNIVSSFDVDHRTLEAGLYLRSVYNIDDQLAVRSWDLRFRRPMAKAPLDSGVVHTIEHLMAYYLRLDEKIGKRIVSFCPMGCLTGFYLSTMQDVEAEDIRQALAKMYKRVFPIKSTDDIVGLNEVQCGNPRLYAIEPTNEAMAEYMRVLFNETEAAELGIADVYKAKCGAKKVLICAPTDREHRAMRVALDKATNLRNYYDLVEVGIGKALSSSGVAHTLATSPVKYDMLAVIGFAAATLGREQGDIVMPSRAIHHDAIIPDGFIPEITDPRNLCGTDPETIFTGDSFVNADIIREIKSRFGVEAAMFDMEIAAICQVAERYGNIPVLAIKYVSDVPEAGHSEQSYDEFADAYSDFTELLKRIENVEL